MSDLISILKPRKALNKAFLKVKPNRTEIERFKVHLTQLLDRINDAESEEFHKNLLIDFLKKTYYEPNYFINTKGRNDLVIHNGEKATSTVGIIIEAKKPTNKGEMLRAIAPEESQEQMLSKINVKAFQELVLYYLRERITQKNIEIKYLIATNINEWFIFDATIFDRLFAQNTTLVKQFNDFENGRLAETKTDFFYKQIAEPFIANLTHDIEFTYFDIREYEKPLRNDDRKDDNKLIALFKLFSPEHLLKLPFANDSNSLDKRFYGELLHIIGLSETKDGNKKLIQRKKEGERHSGSLLENAIIQLDSLDRISRLENASQFGKTVEEKFFNVGLELCITWVNRILFLKLLEAQLVAYHKGDKSYEFFNIAKIKNYDDLNSLFFQVLARKHNERNEDVSALFANVPYLNSSLFEPTEMEHQTLFISNLKDDKTIPIFSQTVLKDSQGKKRTGQLTTLDYFFTFLDAYDFSSEGREEIQEDNKTLINASVLGLIFEKINGYKDGSFFTPGFITMYMARETIRKAVVQKFNEAKGWHCSDMTTLYDKIEDKNEANKIINDLKICDPAVGSGHFLVSALNEIIAIKSELGILLDRNGRSLKEYLIEVVNDELSITEKETDDFFYYVAPAPRAEKNIQNKFDGDAFRFLPHQIPERQRVQQSLFHEKQIIIENCLFGVDINPNSVKICRLRLWIELLKHAYYKPESNYTELETLPNIDINIKCGNSLISRFDLNADLKQIAKSTRWNIGSYQNAVDSYKNSSDKQVKHEIERLIQEIKHSYTEAIQQKNPLLQKYYKLKQEYDYKFPENGLFAHEENVDYGGNLKQREEEKQKFANELLKIKTQLDEEKLFSQHNNAFEWRFEFPEVLNENGDFVGFDVVIGNPPYIRQESFSDIKSFLQSKFKIYHSIADLLTYFVELGYNILRANGTFQFIISNKFTRANYGQVMRKFLVDKTTLTHFIDFSGIPVFDEATVDAAILGFTKRVIPNNIFLYADVNKEILKINQFYHYLKSTQIDFSQNMLNADAWAFETSEVQKIKQKVEAQGVALKDWDITINYGIKTGLNEAFVIDGKKKEEFIAKDPKCAEILKPLLRGRDIQKYYPDFHDLWLIGTFPNKNYNIDDYPAIKDYLKSFGEKLKQTGETGTRKKTNNKRFETQDNIAYWQDFEKPKIIYPNMTKFLPFVIDLENNYYHNDKSFHLVGDRIYWLGAFLNSTLFKYCFSDNFPELLGGTRELRKVFFDKIAVKQISSESEKPFMELVTEIIEIKKQNPSADTTSLETQIDQMVYQLYGLTEEEIAIVENGVNVK